MKTRIGNYICDKCNNEQHDIELKIGKIIICPSCGNREKIRDKGLETLSTIIGLAIVFMISALLGIVAILIIATAAMIIVEVNYRVKRNKLIKILSEKRSRCNNIN